MSDLQERLMRRLEELGFANGQHAAILAHDLAEVLARCRTLEEQVLPLLLQVSQERRSLLAEVTVGIKNHLDAMQDSITDMQASLQALTDFLLRDSE
jgi:hypothetical protein